VCVGGVCGGAVSDKGRIAQHPRILLVGCKYTSVCVTHTGTHTQAHRRSHTLTHTSTQAAYRTAKAMLSSLRLKLEVISAPDAPPAPPAGNAAAGVQGGAAM